MSFPIFLDWDGVLIDSLHLYLNLFRDLCEAHSKKLPILNREDFRGWYEADWKRNFDSLGFTDGQYEEICSSYPETLSYHDADFFEGVPQMIEELSSQHPLVVVSTAPTENIRSRLEAAGLRKYFERVTGSDDGSTEKTERLATLLDDYQTQRGVMVGDTDLDIIAGRENGLVTVGVSYGWISETRMSRVEPDHLVAKPGDLASTLREVVGLSPVSGA